ncbi:MAG: hypothetical protein ACR2QK_10425 [Acidimicrobiales bacterium]
MRFTKPFWDGIADGSITVAFRTWKTPTVVAGRPYRTGGGRLEVVSVDGIEPSAITKADAHRAGYRSIDEVVDQLNPGRDRSLYRVRFRLIDEPDPRDQLASQQNLSGDDIADIAARLARLDRASRSGPWTAQTLDLIERHPARRAPDLAEMVGRETKPFKLDVRKLKNLGLTTSLKIGYELSPRGRAFLDSARPAG